MSLATSGRAGKEKIRVLCRPREGLNPIPAHVQCTLVARIEDLEPTALLARIKGAVSVALGDPSDVFQP